MKKIGFIVFFMWLTLSMTAQDKHFTQFYASPMTLNPALTGAFNGKYRLSMIYRDQWRAVLGHPFVTFSTAFDMRFNLGAPSKYYKNVASGGLLFYADKVPGIDFNTNTMALSGAFHKALDPRRNQYLSVGFKFGMTQRNINYEKLFFDDQFNDVNGYTDPTGEALPPNNFSFADYAVGVNYTSTTENGFSTFIGLALDHFNEPYITFYDREEFPDAKSRLFKKYTAVLGFQLPISERIRLLPRALAMLQGPHMEANAGTNIRIEVSDFHSVALHIGSWVRGVTTKDNAFDLDSVIGMVGIEYSNVLLGLSYDANLTDLNASRQGQGAFEISIAYLGNYENETVLCPKF